MRTNMKNYYKILSVPQTATEDMVKHSYRELAKKYHPDVNPDNPVAARKFSDINEAYSVLTDTQKRAEYDAMLYRESMLRQTYQQAPNAQQAGNPYRAQNVYAYQTQGGTQYQQQGANPYQAQNAYAFHAQGGYAHQMPNSAQYQAQGPFTFQAGTVYQAQQASSPFQAQRQVNPNAIREKAYTAGYENGYKSGRAAAETDERKIVAVLKSLTAENEKLKRQIAASERTVSELKGKIAELMKEAKPAADRSSEQANQQRRIRPEQKDKTADTTTADKKRERPVESVEERAAKWEEKLILDRQAAKPTLYGTLGVLIWAEDEEITASYEQLKHYFAEKKLGEKLKAVKAAYAVLSNKRKREKYNESIGVTNVKIASERAFRKEYEKAYKDQRLKKALSDFWDKFDALHSFALAGDADAQNELGELYYNGKGVQRDYKQAAALFKAAFDQKHPAATYNLGLCYTKGEGVEKNKTLGERYLAQASALGYTVSDSL